MPSRLTDIAILATLGLFMLQKGLKGFFRILSPTIVTLISIGLAFLLSALLTEPVTKHVFPLAQEQLFSHMDLSAIRSTRLTDVASQLEKLMPETMDNLIRKFNVDVLPYVKQAVEGAASSATARQIAEDAASAVLLPVIRSIVRIFLFFALAVILKLALSLVSKILGLAFELPGVSVLDHLGGAVIGALWGAAFLYIVCWFLDLFFPDQFKVLVESSRLLSIVFKT